MATAPRIPDLAACSADELRTLVIGLLEANARLEAAVAAQAEEIARLKGLKGRPQIKPSGMRRAPIRGREQPPATARPRSGADSGGGSRVSPRARA